MVVKLIAPVVDDDDFFENVLAQRRKGKNKVYFELISKGWLERLKAYDSFGGDPTKISHSIVKVEDKDKFINLYSDTSEGSFHAPYIYKLRRPASRLSLCPACGEEGTPNTLDHYLPKDKFPEFSIHLKNLVPMCDICQGIKLESFIDSGGQKRFLHPYFDAIAQPVMKIRIEPPFASPIRFELIVDSTLAPEFAAQVTRHLIGLGLAARLEDYCQKKYFHLLKLVAFHRRSPVQDVADLLSKFKFMAEQVAVNSWPAVFYRSVLINEDLVEYLRNGDLPTNL